MPNAAAPIMVAPPPVMVTSRGPSAASGAIASWTMAATGDTGTTVPAVIPAPKKASSSGSV